MLRCLVALYIISISFISCNNGLSNDHLSIFKYNESSIIGSLDPAFAKDQATIWATNQLFNGLVQLDKNLKPIPSISKNWIISDDLLIYKFFLRDDVYFHNHQIFNNGIGRRVVAHDFEYSFNRLIDKDVASPGSWILNNVDSFYVEGDSIFIIKLDKPFPAFLSLLSMKYCSVVPYEIVQEGLFSNHPIGTGPFKFQLWKDGVKLVFRKNENYFESHQNKKLPFLDAISITFIKDKQSAFLSFIQGDLDFISGIDGSYKDEVLTFDGKLKEKYKNRINLESIDYLNTEYLGFLMTDSLPIEVRKAINYGFDRFKMLKYLRNNIGEPAINGFIPKGLPSSNKVIGYDYNPEKAKFLLSESNFNLNNTITLSTTSSYLDLCEYIQSQLSDIGLKIKIEVNPPSTHRQMVATSRLSFFRGSWIADYPDEENYLSLFYSKNHSPFGPNYTHFSNKAFDLMYEHSLSEKDDDSRIELYHKMDQMIIDNAAIVPLYYDKVLRFSQRNIQGLESNAMNMLDLKRVRK